MDHPDLQSINLSRLLREGGTAETHGEIYGAIQAGKEAFELDGLTLWKTSVTALGDGEFWLSGEIAGKVMMECARCLEPTPAAVRAYFQHIIRYQPGQPQIELIEEDEEEIYLFGHPDLDLSPFLAEALISAMPFAVLCKEDCQGLCPVCGANRNAVDCGHAKTHQGGKLARLRGFLDEV
ncbi:MAG: metal-binding protein [Meiothermus sp.]